MGMLIFGFADVLALPRTVYIHIYTYMGMLFVGFA